MGNNDKHFWGSREQRKNVRDQGNTSKKHFREQVVLLMRNKGKIKKDQGNMNPPPPLPGTGSEIKLVILAVSRYFVCLAHISVLLLLLAIVSSYF